MAKLVEKPTFFWLSVRTDTNFLPTNIEDEISSPLKKVGGVRNSTTYASDGSDEFRFKSR